MALDLLGLRRLEESRGFEALANALALLTERLAGDATLRVVDLVFATFLVDAEREAGVFVFLTVELDLLAFLAVAVIMLSFSLAFFTARLVFETADGTKGLV